MLTLQTCHVETDAELELSLAERREGAARRLDWRVAHVGGGDAFRGAVRLVHRLPAALAAPWFMVPGWFYGENRPAAADGPGCLYPRYDPAAQTPQSMTARWWHFGADRTATPLVYAHAGEQYRALCSAPTYRLEGEAASEDDVPQVGLGFGTDAEGAWLALTLPACEEPFSYRNLPEEAPARRRLRLPPGAAIGGTLWLHEGEGPRHSYQEVLEAADERFAADHPPAPAPPLAELVADALHGITRAHYVEGGNYFAFSRSFDPVAEQIANGRGFSLEWHQDMIGFVGGLMVCHALLAGCRVRPDAHARAVALREAERWCRDGLSPSGLFWADYAPPTIHTPNGSFPNPVAEGREAYGSGWLPAGSGLLHSRTVADACDHLAAMIELEETARGRSEATALWRDALAANVEAVLALQGDDGSYGQYYRAADGGVAKAEGCGGLLWIPALLKARRLAGTQEARAARLLASVRAAGEAYAPYVEAESIWGAPEDNDSPTSEDGMNAVMAYCDLYAATGEERWLRLAVTAADWMLTFRRTFNQALPAETMMARYGLRSRGGDFASVCNNHLHVFEVLCTRHLCRLSEWTGRAYYRRRARDHWCFVSQYLCREDGMYNGFRGAMSEQFYWTDWGAWMGWRPPPHHRQKGHLCPFSTLWCIAMIPLAAPDVREAFGD